MPPLERRHWMDGLRGLAVLLVASWHAFSIPYTDIPGGVEWVCDFLSVYRIPLLLFLSGLLLDQSVRKPTGAYVSGKLRRIGWPLVVWSTILVLIGWPSADPTDPWFWLGEGDYLWYLGVLLACYAIGLLTRFVHPVVFLVVGFAVMELLRTEVDFLTNVSWFGLYFFAGATLSRWLDRWLSFGPLVPSLFMALSLAWAGYSATVNGYVPVLHWRPFLLSTLGVVGLVWFANRLPRARWLEWVGQRSIVFYVAHVPLIHLTMVALHGALAVPYTYLLVHLVMYAGCFLLARFAGRSLLFEFPQPRRLRAVRPADA